MFRLTSLLSTHVVYSHVHYAKMCKVDGLTAGHTNLSSGINPYVSGQSVVSLQSQISIRHSPVQTARTAVMTSTAHINAESDSQDFLSNSLTRILSLAYKRTWESPNISKD